MDTERSLNFSACKAQLQRSKLIATFYSETHFVELEWKDERGKLVANGTMKDRLSANAKVACYYPLEFYFDGEQGFKLCTYCRELEVIVVE